MAVFSSDQVNHVFVNGINGATCDYSAATVGAKNAAVVAKDKDEKYIGGVTFDEVTKVTVQTLKSVKCPQLTFALPAGMTSADIKDGDEVEVVVKINGALCDDEGNELSFVGIGEDLAEAMTDLKNQIYTPAGDKKNALAAQLIDTDGASIVWLAPTTQDPALGDLRVVPVFNGFTKVTKANADGVITPMSKVVAEAAAKGENAAVWATAGQLAYAFEYFALGERADLYRNIGWPNSRPSKTVLTGAETFDEIKITTIEGFYAGDCEDVQKSKKMVSVIEPA